MRTKKEPIVDSRYMEQQEALNEIASSLGVVAYRPEYHHALGDKNTVLFYLKEDEAHNRKVDRQPTHYTRSEARDLKKYKGIEISPEYVYRDHFWSFENSDRNGLGDMGYANNGKVDLRGTNWKDVLEGHIRLALAKKWQRQHIASCGGYLEMREADSVNNDLNRLQIEAMKMIHGTVYLMDVNYYGDKRKRIIDGEESIYEEVDNPDEVCNFAGSYCVPVKDQDLETLVRQWNRSDALPKSGKDVDKITGRVEQIGGIILVWS